MDSIDVITSNLDMLYEKDIEELIYLLVEDICRNEGCSFKDIQYIATGGYSKVFEIGDKILKISTDRKTIKIPDNPYIIRPLLRCFLADNLFVEVTEKAQVCDDISNEELYELYKKLRDFGIIWTDVNKRNVGRLIKDNKIYWRDNIIPNSKCLNLVDRDFNNYLKKGELVVIDSDCMYSIDNFKHSFEDSYFAAFEYQYKKDRKTR